MAVIASRLPDAWGLKDEPLPALRRGLLVAAPVGIALVLDLWMDDKLAGAIGTAILISGFVAFDAPARVRVRWHLLTAPFVGLAAALGVLTSQSTGLTIAAMAVVATVCGYLFAVSLRLAIGGLTVTLALLITQGLYLPTADAGDALLIGIGGSLAQAANAAITWLVSDRGREAFDVASALRDTTTRLRSNLSLRSPYMRHALRFGAAMAIGVAIYRFADDRDHGYWVPLTILFVLKPDPDQTMERIGMRAAGHGGRPARRDRAGRGAQRRRDPDHDRAHALRGVRLRAAGDRVRAVYDRDHRLRRPAHRHPRHRPVRRGGRAGPRDGDRHRRRGAGVPRVRHRRGGGPGEGRSGGGGGRPRSYVNPGAIGSAGGAGSDHAPARPRRAGARAAAFRGAGSGPVGPMRFAGSDLSSEWTGYMEGALRSGIAAAEEALEEL